MILCSKRKVAKSRTVECVICSTKFKTTHSQGRYCSEECRQIGHRKSWKKYGDKNRKSRNEFGRHYYKTVKEKRIIQIKEYRNTLGGKEMIRKADEKYRREYPERCKARREVSKAKEKGIIIQEPCSVCGESITEAHHIDYNKPLDVVWLCNQHHREIHIEAKELST